MAFWGCFIVSHLKIYSIHKNIAEKKEEIKYHFIFSKVNVSLLHIPHTSRYFISGSNLTVNVIFKFSAHNQICTGFRSETSPSYDPSSRLLLARTIFCV